MGRRCSAALISVGPRDPASHPLLITPPGERAKPECCEAAHCAPFSKPTQDGAWPVAPDNGGNIPIFLSGIFLSHRVGPCRCARCPKERPGRTLTGKWRTGRWERGELMAKPHSGRVRVLWEPGFETASCVVSFLSLGFFALSAPCESNAAWP